jgi:hypothetical protein
VPDSSNHALPKLIRWHGGDGAPDIGVVKRRLEIGRVTLRHISKRAGPTIEITHVIYIGNTNSIVTVAMPPPPIGSIKGPQRAPANRTETKAQSEAAAEAES